nr:ribonuclease H-like domain, reverse transcriptase, RNA-dependent DNA polymerase [Tanacetum cinerariifolium]
MSYLIDYKEIDRGYVAFVGNPKGGEITRKGTKDETTGILKSFITRIENLVDHKVKVIICNNGTEFKNREMNHFCEMKDPLGKFDGKDDEGFFIGYSLNSKAFKVFNSRTRIVEQNLHIRFSESTPNVVNEDPRQKSECKDQEKQDNVSNTNTVNAVSTNRVNAVGENISIELRFDLNMPALEDIGTFNFTNKDEDDDVVVDINNLDTTIQVSPTPTTRINKDHPLDQVIGDSHSATQTRQISKNLEEHGFVSTIQQRTNHKDLQNCLFACFLSQKEPKKISSIGELTFFLGLQVKQKNDGIFIYQDKYVAEILKKFRFTKVKIASTPMESQKPLLKDEDGKEVDVHMYRVNGKEIIITESSIRKDLRLTDEDGVDCLPNSTIFENLQFMRKPKRKNTHVPQSSGSIEHVADKAVYKERGDILVRATTTASSLEEEQDSGNIDKTQSKATPNEASSPGTTSGGGPRVLALEMIKTTQALEIDSLKRRIKKLKKKQRLRMHKLKILYKRRKMDDIDADEDITLVNAQDNAEMFDVTNLHGEEVFVDNDDSAKEVNDVGELNAASIATTVSVAAKITTKEVTLAKALAELKASKPKVKGVFIQDPSKFITTTTTTISLKKSLEKAKEEQVLAREKAQKELEANIALIKTWDDVQAKINADYQLARRLQAEEQQELTDEKKDTLFMQLLEKRIKLFVAKIAEEKRNKPPTQAQQRKIMCTYLKNKEGKKLKDLKNKSFDSIHKIFDKDFKRVNTFEPISLKLVQEEVALDAIPLTAKSPKIVNRKICKEGKKSYYQIIRVDGYSKMYMIFNRMLKDFDKEDLEDLYSLTMFEPHVEDQAWKKQHGYKVLEWKLYDSCEVHFLRMQSVHIYMLVEKKYPLTTPKLIDMLNKKLKINYQITTVGTRVKTASESYYYQYKEVNTGQVEVSVAQEL